VLLDQGMSCSDVAKVLLLDDDAVRTWYRLYEEDGIEGLARLIQRIAEIQKRQLYKALNPHIDPVSRPLHSPDRREFRFVRTLWSPKPAAVRLCLR
jgi:hypothetical protein